MQVLNRTPHLQPQWPRLVIIDGHNCCTSKLISSQLLMHYSFEYCVIFMHCSLVFIALLLVLWMLCYFAVLMAKMGNQQAPAVDCSEYERIAVYSINSVSNLIQALKVYPNYPPEADAIYDALSNFPSMLQQKEFAEVKDTLDALSEPIDTLSRFDPGDVVGRSLAKPIKTILNSFKQNMIDNLKIACKNNKVKRRLHGSCSYCEHFDESEHCGRTVTVQPSTSKASSTESLLEQRKKELFGSHKVRLSNVQKEAFVLQTKAKRAKPLSPQLKSLIAEKDPEPKVEPVKVTPAESTIESQILRDAYRMYRANFKEADITSKVRFGNDRYEVLETSYGRFIRRTPPSPPASVSSVISDTSDYEPGPDDWKYEDRYDSDNNLLN